MLDSVIGFDIRVTHADNQLERRKPILRSKALPLYSIDPVVWPRPEAYSNWLRLLEQSDNSYDHSIAGLWAQLKELVSEFRSSGTYISYELEVVAISTRHAVQMIDPISGVHTTHYVRDAIPPILDDSWSFAGFDVGDCWLRSYLFSFEDEQLFSLAASANINNVRSTNGLFVNYQDAYQYASWFSRVTAQVGELMHDSDQPPLVFGVFHQRFVCEQVRSNKC